MQNVSSIGVTYIQCCLLNLTCKCAQNFLTYFYSRVTGMEDSAESDGPYSYHIQKVQQLLPRDHADQVQVCR